MLNNVEDILEVFESILLEKRPVLKLKALNDALGSSIGEDLGILLSIKYHKLLSIPKPKWTNATVPQSGQLEAVLSNILSYGSFDIKELHELPLKVQTVLYYSSTCADIGLNDNQLLSSVDILSVENIIKKLNIKEIYSEEPRHEYMCHKCGVKINAGEVICSTCLEDITKATIFALDNFSIYGTAIKDFRISFRDWTVNVTNNLYTFTREDSSKETYQMSIPFKEYQETLQLL